VQNGQILVFESYIEELARSIWNGRSSINLYVHPAA
jgi:hypothetical protein